MVVCYSTDVSALPWETQTQEIGSFQSRSKMTLVWLAISSTLINLDAADIPAFAGKLSD